MNEKPLYDDKFLKIGEWLHSAAELIIGIALALVLGIVVHWIAGLVVIVFTIVGAIASYMIFKK